MVNPGRSESIGPLIIADVLEQIDLNLLGEVQITSGRHTGRKSSLDHPNPIAHLRLKLAAMDHLRRSYNALPVPFLAVEPH